MKEVLKITNLTKRFGGLVAVNNLDLTLESGGVHSLIGPNGSGKTTTINLITGILKSDEGSILFNGQEITGKSPHAIARVGLRRTYQDIRLFPTMTIHENVMVGAHFETKSGIIRTIFDAASFRSEEKFLSERADEVLSLLGLYEKKNELAGSQPYGIRKITELGTAMISQPALVLLDEPAAGLNPSERSNFIKIILNIVERGVKILLVEHNMDVVMNISDTITVLNFGTKIAEGTPEEIQCNEEVIKAYLGKKQKTGGYRHCCK